MIKNSTARSALVPPGLSTALEETTGSLVRLCLAAGLETICQLMEAEAVGLGGPRYPR